MTREELNDKISAIQYIVNNDLIDSDMMEEAHSDMMDLIEQRDALEQESE